MNKLLIVSPHFDDAVLSAGQFMADRPDTEVVTIFGGFPDSADKISSPYDTKCGFKNALDAVSERRREDSAATALLNATHVHLDFPDGQYGQDVSQQQIADVLQRVIDGGTYEAIYAPLGLGHPDHMKVTDAVLSLDTELPITLWEDIPIRVTEPELVAPRLAKLGLEYKPTHIIFNRVRIADKVRSMLCYSSQINTGILDPYIMYVPERFYSYKQNRSSNE